MSSLRRRARCRVTAVAVMMIIPLSVVAGTAAAAPARAIVVAGASQKTPPAPAALPGAGSGGSGNLVYTFSTSPEAAKAAAACTPIAAGDDVHVTDGSASGHSYWYQGNCSDAKATVRITLQEFYSDGTWRVKGTIGQKANVYPGTGSANRAVSKAACANVVVAAWRSLVAVQTPSGGPRRGILKPRISRAALSKMFSWTRLKTRRFDKIACLRGERSGQA